MSNVEMNILMLSNESFAESWEKEKYNCGYDHITAESRLGEFFRHLIHR